MTLSKTFRKNDNFSIQFDSYYIVYAIQYGQRQEQNLDFFNTRKRSQAVEVRNWKFLTFGTSITTQYSEMTEVPVI